MKIHKEAEILTQAVRSTILRNIMDNPGIRARKLEHAKRYEVYKDRTREYALRILRTEMGLESAKEMEARTPNFNIMKKIVKKKARVYKDRPKRTVSTEDQASADGAAVEPDKKKQEQLEAYVEATGLDSFMKEVNRSVETHQNILVQLMPHIDTEDLTPQLQSKWDVALKILRPDRFDVIEDPNNPKEPLVVILSYFDEGAGVISDYREPRQSTSTAVAENESSRTSGKAMPMDGKKRLFVWWSRSYHFTTDEAGTIQTKEDMDEKQKKGENPFGVLPFESFAKEQTEGFWSDGGEGKADNAIMLNLLLSDINYASKYQGMGLGWMAGRGDKMPTAAYIGPSRFLKMPYEEGEPKPEVGFATANPKLSEMLDVVREQLGFFLTSEDLEPGSITGDLSPGNASSGFQEMIQKSEPITAIEDEQQLYKDKEPNLMRKFQVIAAVYQAQGLLCSELDAAGKASNLVDYDLIFVPPQVVLTEEQRVDVVGKKQKLNLYTQTELLQDLHPDLTKEAIKKKELVLAGKDPEADPTKDPAADPANPPAAKPAPAGGPPPTGDPAGGTIAQVSLNGIQVNSIVDVMKAVIDGQFPVESAQALIEASFPSLTTEQVSAILKPLANFKKKELPVVPAPGNPPPVPPKAPPQDPPKPPPPPPAP